MRIITKDPEEITRNIFIEQFSHSCRIQRFDEHTKPLPPQCLQDEQTIGKEEYSHSGSSSTFVYCGSTGSKRSLENTHHDVNELTINAELTTPSEVTLGIEHFWEVVTVEDFSDMMKTIFDQYHG